MVDEALYFQDLFSIIGFWKANPNEGKTDCFWMIDELASVCSRFVRDN